MGTMAKWQGDSHCTAPAGCSRKVCEDLVLSDGKFFSASCLPTDKRHLAQDSDANWFCLYGSQLLYRSGSQSERQNPQGI